MEITKEEILKRIENLKAQQEQMIAQLNAITGAIKAFEGLLEEPKEVEPEVK